MFVQHLGGGAGAEAGHADEDAGFADEPFPALADPGFHGDPHIGFADHLGLVVARLGVEQLPAGGRDHAGADALGFQQGAGGQRHRDLGAGCKDRHLGRVLGPQQLVGAPRRQVLTGHDGPRRRDLLPRQGHDRRRGAGLQREFPAFGGLHRVGGAEHVEVGDRAQGRHMFDRLVGRAILADPDAIVRHHVDHAGAHQGPQPDRRAAVVGEHQEGARIGDDAPM